MSTASTTLRPFGPMIQAPLGLPVARRGHGVAQRKLRDGPSSLRWTSGSVSMMRSARLRGAEVGRILVMVDGAVACEVVAGGLYLGA